MVPCYPLVGVISGDKTLGRYATIDSVEVFLIYYHFVNTSAKSRAACLMGPLTFIDERKGQMDMRVFMDRAPGRPPVQMDMRVLMDREPYRALWGRMGHVRPCTALYGALYSIGPYFGCYSPCVGYPI